MSEINISEFKIRPEFDLEEYMNLSHETRIEAATLEKLEKLWTEWSEALRTVKMENGKKSWLAVWLPEIIERTVDETWEEAPSVGYMLNALAQYLCMSAAGEALPQVAAGGCAPSPAPEKALMDCLAKTELTYAAEGLNALNRRYAILTWYPFRGGCEICSVKEDCPRDAMAREFAGITLPGYERGVSDQG